MADKVETAELREKAFTISYKEWAGTLVAGYYVNIPNYNGGLVVRIEDAEAAIEAARGELCPYHKTVAAGVETAAEIAGGILTCSRFKDDFGGSLCPNINGTISHDADCPGAFREDVAAAIEAAERRGAERGYRLMSSFSDGQTSLEWIGKDSRLGLVFDMLGTSSWFLVVDGSSESGMFKDDIDLERLANAARKLRSHSEGGTHDGAREKTD